MRIPFDVEVVSWSGLVVFVTLVLAVTVTVSVARMRRRVASTQEPRRQPEPSAKLSWKAESNSIPVTRKMRRGADEGNSGNNQAGERSPADYGQEQEQQDTDNNWRCACEGGFLPPGLLKSFGGAEAVLRLGTGQCYHKQV